MIHVGCMRRRDRVLMRDMIRGSGMHACMVLDGRRRGSRWHARVMFMTLHGNAFFLSMMIVIAVLAVVHS